MSDDELRALRYAAAFHDIGKIAVPDSILNKPGPLTEAERREVERHPLVGEQILEPVEFLDARTPARAPLPRALGRRAATRTGSRATASRWARA